MDNKSQIKNNSKNNPLIDSDELQIKMKINKNSTLKSSSKQPISNEMKIKEFMKKEKNQNNFDKLLLSFFKEQKDINKRLEKAIIHNSQEIEKLKKELLIIKKFLIKHLTRWFPHGILILSKEKRYL